MTQKDRLDDSRSNLYADQLNRGFRGLRFLPELERDYRRYMLEDSFALKRIASASACSSGWRSSASTC